MAYGLRYEGTLINHFNQTVEAKIYENGYTGSAETVTLAGINKNINGSDEDLFVSILGSEITVGLLSETDFKYIDLYTGNSRKYKLQIEIDSVLDWTGWIIPENFTEPYAGTPYITQVTARDGLGELSSIPYNVAIDSVTTYQSVLYGILFNIGTLNVKIGVNIYEENQVTTSSSLSQAYVDTSIYEGLTANDVLIDLLNLYGARIYQSGAEWYFVNTVEFESELRVFNGGTELTRNTEILIGIPKTDKFANTDQTLNILPAWKEQTIIRDFIFNGSALLNYEFDDWSQIGVEYLPVNWSQSGTNTVDRYSSKNKASVRFLDYATIQQPQSYIFQLIQNIKGAKHGLKLNLSFKINKLTEDDLLVSSQFWIKIINTSVGANQYLTNESAWTTTESFVNFQDISVKSKYDSQYLDYEISNTLVIPNDGSLEVYIYSAFGAYLILDNFQLQLTFPVILPLSPDQFGAYPDEPITDLIQIGNNTYIPDDLNLITGDFPDLIKTGVLPYNGELNEQHIYKGGIFLSSDKSTVTSNWSKIPVDYTNKTNLHIIVSDAKNTKVNLPQWAISGTILSKDIQSDSTIVDYEVNNNKYLLCNGNYDMERCLFNGTFIQIGNADDAVWILGDPSAIWNDGNNWNDNGQWIDGVEVTIELSGTGFHNISAYVAQGDTITVLPNDEGTPTNDELRDGGIIDPIDSVPYEITNPTVGFISDVTNLVSYTITFNAEVSGTSTFFTVNITI